MSKVYLIFCIGLMYVIRTFLVLCMGTSPVAFLDAALYCSGHFSLCSHSITVHLQLVPVWQYGKAIQVTSLLTHCATF